MSTDAFTADFKGYQEKITSSLVAVIKNANQVAAEDLSFHRNTSNRISSSLDQQNAFLLKLTSKLLGAVTKDTNVKAPTFRTLDDVDDKWKSTIDIIDNTLEKADVYIDEYNGGITRNTPQSSTPEPVPNKPRTNTMLHMPYSANMVKPQKSFSRKVNNFDTSMWKPLLTKKPHAAVSLGDSLVVVDGAYKHPYEFEIQQSKFPERVYQESTPILYTSPSENEPIWVDTEEGVREMLDELKLAQEIAVDLEHNDRNSYVGLVSLMQISTRERDWVIDTLRPWRENLQVLNEVFTDPAIVKVFHGSASDMIWLQRDLGIYVVGLFDTYWAATALFYKTKSLAHLLQTFCNFNAQKQYQTADWRIRPLPNELLDYARSDTHYLLYIYDNMRNALIQASTDSTNLIDEVLEDSKKEALQVYERRPYDRENGHGSEGWLKILARLPGNISKEQLGVLKNLHEWRDQKAREADEGTSSVMSNKFLTGCVERPPQLASQFYNARVLGKASQWVLSNVAELLELVESGKREGANGPSVQEVLERNKDQLAKLRRFYVPKPEKTKTVQPGLAETMRKLVSNGEFTNGDGNTSEPMVARISTSSLWGTTGTYGATPVTDLKPAEIALESIRPIGTFAHISAPKSSPGATDNTKLSEVDQSDLNGQARVVDEPDIHVPFTLRNQNKKRGVESIEEDENVLSTNVQHSDKFAITDEGKVTRYSDARRAFKSQNDANKQVESNSFQPFDYANAESILHSRPNPTATDGIASSVAKPFNPFAKSLDTSTGAKRNRMGKELAGRSHTFKS